MRNKLVYGVGFNDADYLVKPTLNGKSVSCPFYRVWVDMLGRCYCDKIKAKRPTYAECRVCDDWLVFSKFKSWMEMQNWEGRSLDKDIIVVGNKLYAPDMCAFVDQATNSFVHDGGCRSGDLLIGAYWDNQQKKFMAQCCNTIKKKREYLGRFTSELDAHIAWKKRKHELACQLADMQTDERVAKALRQRYA